MNYIVSSLTDIGLTKSTNQDSHFVGVYSGQKGKYVLAILCDGMGGLAKGEVASASVVKAYRDWANNRLPYYDANEVNISEIQIEWNDIAIQFNEKIARYAKQFGASMGTTITIMLIFANQFLIMNVGDTRAYEIYSEAFVLTKDQSVVAKEVELGYMTWEQAEKDYRRSVLLQCIGASDQVVPDFYQGIIKNDAVYMLCSDGFRHEVTKDELYAYLNPNNMLSEEQMYQNMQSLVNLNKQRQERDNITVITIRTC